MGERKGWSRGAGSGRRRATPASRSATWTRGSSRESTVTSPASGEASGAGGEDLLEAPEPSRGQRALLVVDDQHPPPAVAPEQDRVGQRGQHRFQRRRDRLVAARQSAEDGPHATRRQLVEDGLGRRAEPVPDERLARLEEPVDCDPGRRVPALDPDQLDEGGEERVPVGTTAAPGPVERERGPAVVQRQPGAVRIGRLAQEQVDDPGDEEELLVHQVYVRPPGQRGQEPLQRHVRAAQELPGLELVQRRPGPQRGDQLDRLTDVQVDAGVRDHRRGRVQQVAAGEAGLVAGDLHDGAGDAGHRRQAALRRQPHPRLHDHADHRRLPAGVQPPNSGPAG